MRIFTAFIVVLACTPLDAADHRADSVQSLGAALRRARPGDRVLVAPGTYRAAASNRKTFYAGDIKGAEGKPITITAADPQRPPVFEGGSENFQLSNCRYIIVDRIHTRAATVNNFQFDVCEHIIISNCVSSDIADKGNCDGIKMPGCADFLIYNCQVRNWGTEGSAIDMVGCARGLIMKSRFSFPRVDGWTANGVQGKGAGQRIGVYQCRFDDASFRAIQFGGTSVASFHGRKPQPGKRGHAAYDMAAMGNVIHSGEAPVAYASAADCVFAYNTIVNPRKYILRVLKEGPFDPQRGNTFTRNLIVYGQIGQVLNTSGNEPADAVTLSENYWYNPLSASKSIPQRGVKLKDPAGGLNPQLDDKFNPHVERALGYGAFAEELAAAWEEHVKGFEWAWEQAKQLDGGGKD